MSNPRYANGNFRRKARQRFAAMAAPCGICHGKLGAIHYDEPSNAQHPLSFVIDEVKPISRWRENGYNSARAAAEDADNLQAAHYYCNALKSNKTQAAAEYKLQKNNAFSVKASTAPRDGDW